jgi:transcriptional regulator with XRE-family HTH domain
VEAQAPDAADTAALGRGLGRQLASLRQAAGLTQHQLAELVGYSRGTLSSAESGRFDQARRFWQRIDDMLNAQGRLVGRYDDLRFRLAARREQQALAQRVRRETGLAAAAPGGTEAGRQPPPLRPPTSSTDVHVWFTTAEGITHCVIIPRSRVSPELVIDTLAKMLDNADDACEQAE